MIHQPCFDVKTRTDCPDRKAGCGASCEKWAEYVKARDEFYERRARIKREQMSLRNYYFCVHERLKKMYKENE